MPSAGRRRSAAHAGAPAEPDRAPSPTRMPMPTTSRPMPTPTRRHRAAALFAACAACAASAVPAAGQAPHRAARAATRPAPAPAALVDEQFADAAALGRWTWFHEAERWPDMRRRAEVRPAGTGELYLEPYTSGWYADFHAPFLYRTVAGDFVATARVLAEAPGGGVPSVPWSLGGLMVRAARAVDSATWTPGGERWLFITAGVAGEASRPVLETKTTVGSRSTLQLHPVRAGWVELRVTRAGRAFELASRHDGEGWVVRARFDRPDLPDTLQVGINAYTDWYHASALHGDPRRFNTTVLRDGRAGLGLRVDWVRVARPAARAAAADR